MWYYFFRKLSDVLSDDSVQGDLYMSTSSSVIAWKLGLATKKTQRGRRRAKPITKSLGENNRPTKGSGPTTRVTYKKAWENCFQYLKRIESVSDALKADIGRIRNGTVGRDEAEKTLAELVAKLASPPLHRKQRKGAEEVLQIVEIRISQIAKATS